LERAYAHFFARRADFPRFKKKGQSDSFRYPQGVKLDRASSRIFLPKPGWLHYRNSRDVLGTVKNVTVSQSFEDLQVRNMSRSAAGSTE
jgi:putative transposase